MGAKLDAFLKKTYIWILVLFGVGFHYFVQPKLYDLFVIDHSKDCFNQWQKGENWEFKIFLSNTDKPKSPREYKLLKHVTGLKYESKRFAGDLILDLNYTLPLTDNVKNNKTIPYFYIHASPARCGFRDFLPEEGIPCYTINVAAPIIHWVQKRIEKERNLLNGEAPVIVQNETLPLLPYVFQNMSFDIVADHEARNYQQLSSFNGIYYRFAVDNHLFIPPISEDQFMHIETRRTFLNFTTNTSVDFNIQVHLRNRWLWNFKLESDSGSDEYEYVHKQWEDLKRAMADTKPLLLWSWIIVTIAHVLLNMLAFKEDISWWNERKSLAGVSLQSLIFNSFSQLIIFLYLMDEDTSPIVRLMKGIAVAVEFWKISKILEPIMEFPYFKVKGQYKDSTADFDSQGGKYLRWAMYPIILGYAIYSIIFKKFKSFYSFVLKVSVGAVYGFGFLAMLPQLYVNYKLKSVAGMSGPVLAFKFVSTFVDDLFAFVMTMPLMHRIACFRDDIVFFIWLYQRHIYKIDPNRANEYGEQLTNKKEEEENKEEKTEEKPVDQNTTEVTQRTPTSKKDD